MVELKCVIGTNSWGSRAYEKVVRGSYVDDSVIEEAVDKAIAEGLTVFDTADDYGFGYAQKLIGKFREAGKKFEISAKYTPTGTYKPNQIHRAFEKQCAAMKTDYVDYYWLHLPNDVEKNLTEIIDLYRNGKIGNVGVSNFNLQEVIHAKKFLESQGVPLYGVQNHFSLLDREEEETIDWCRENGIAFWGWAVLEEGILSGNTKSPIGRFFGGKVKKLHHLLNVMEEVGTAHGLTTAQVAVAYCVNKDVIPVCGCRKPYQAEQLVQDAEVNFSEEEMNRLEKTADETRVKILKSDMFRSFVHKDEKKSGLPAAVLAAFGAMALAMVLYRKKRK